MKAVRIYENGNSMVLENVLIRVVGTLVNSVE